MSTTQYPEAKLIAGINARRAGDEDSRLKITITERQVTDDLLLEVGSIAVVLSLVEADALSQLLTDMAERVQGKVEARP